MARPPIERAVGGVPRVTLFKPAGVPGRELEQLPLAVDELEAIRLVDLEGLSHEQAAAAMGVSRQTIGRVLDRGRAKVAEALVAGKAILIGGGQYRVEPRQLCCRACGAVWRAEESVPATLCPSCASPEVITCWDPVGRCGMGRGPGKGGGRGACGGRRGGHGAGGHGGRRGGRERGGPGSGDAP
jgi:predicted DNA-binding protein (UPF0251 family)